MLSIQGGVPKDLLYKEQEIRNKARKTHCLKTKMRKFLDSKFRAQDNVPLNLSPNTQGRMKKPQDGVLF